MSSPYPGSPRSPAGERASRVAAGLGRARWSGRQSLPTTSPPGGKDTATRRRLHPGAETVFLGAMALLGLVGLLHRECPEDPLHPASGTVAPSSPKGTQTRRHPTGYMARHRPADDMTRPEGVSNDGAALQRGGVPFLRDVTHGYSHGVCQNRLATPSAAVLSSPGPRRRDARGRPSGGLGSRRRGPRHPRRRMAVPSARDPALPTVMSPAAPTYRPPPRASRSHRTNGREAGLASRPG